MRELTYVARRTVEWREAPDPKIQADGEAIVAPVAATSCDVDSSILAGHGFIGPPFALGHECIARVVETGDAITAVVPGDLVVVPWSINCGTCERCRAGPTAHCTAVPYMAMYGAPIGGSWGGLFSDLVRVPTPTPCSSRYRPASTRSPWPPPATTGPWPGAWSPPTSRPAPEPASWSSPAAASACTCATSPAHSAPPKCSTSTPTPEHRTLARAFGAATAETLDPIPQGYDIAVEATGRVGQLALAVKSLTPEGICESAGNHFRPGELPLLDMYLNGVTLRIARDNVRAHIPDALELAASGKVAPEKVVSHVIDWEDLPTALPEKRLKPVFVRADD